MAYVACVQLHQPHLLHDTLSLLPLSFPLPLLLVLGKRLGELQCEAAPTSDTDKALHSCVACPGAAAHGSVCGVVWCGGALGSTCAAMYSVALGEVGGVQSAFLPVLGYSLLQVVLATHSPAKLQVVARSPSSTNPSSQEYTATLW